MTNLVEFNGAEFDLDRLAEYGIEDPEEQRLIREYFARGGDDRSRDREESYWGANEERVPWQFPEGTRHRVFAYGILRSPATVASILGGNWESRMEMAVLQDWERLNTHPAFIVPAPGVQTRGVLIHELDNEDLLALDSVEGISRGVCHAYGRTMVTVTTVNDGERLEAWLYEANLKDRPEREVSLRRQADPAPDWFHESEVTNPTGGARLGGWDSWVTNRPSRKERRRLRWMQRKGGF